MTKSDTQRSDMQKLLEKHNQLFAGDYYDIYGLNVSLPLLIVGFFRQTKFIQFANDRLGVSTVKGLGNGEALAAFLIDASLTQFNHLWESPVVLRQVPLNVFLDLSEGIEVDVFARPLYMSAISALSRYGCEKFLNEFTAQAVKLMTKGKDFAPKSVSLYTTNVNVFAKRGSVWDEYDLEDEYDMDDIEHGAVVMHSGKLTKGVVKPTLVEDLDYTGKPLKHSNPQLSLIGTVRDSIFGIPLGSIFTDEEGAPLMSLTCEQMTQRLLKLAVSVCPSVKYLVCSNASFGNSEVIAAVKQQGRHLIVPAASNCQAANALLAQLAQLRAQMVPMKPLTNSPHGQNLVYGYMKRTKLDEVPVNLLLVNPCMGDKDEKTLKRYRTKAQKECDTINKQLLGTFADLEEFMATAELLQAKAEFCEIKVNGSPVKVGSDKKDAGTGTGTKSKSKKKAAPAKASKAAASGGNANNADNAFVPPQFTVSFAEEDVVAAMERSRCFVLICTNVSPKLQAEEIYQQYRGAQDLPHLWRVFLEHKFIVEKAFFKKQGKQGQEIADGLKALMSLVAFAYQLMFKDLNAIFAKKALEKDMPYYLTRFSTINFSTTNEDLLKNMYEYNAVNLQCRLSTGEMELTGVTAPLPEPSKGQKRIRARANKSFHESPIRWFAELGESWSYFLQLDTYWSKPLWCLREKLLNDIEFSER